MSTLLAAARNRHEQGRDSSTNRSGPCCRTRLPPAALCHAAAAANSGVSSSFAHLVLLLLFLASLLSPPPSRPSPPNPPPLSLLLLLLLCLLLRLLSLLSMLFYYFRLLFCVLFRVGAWFRWIQNHTYTPCNYAPIYQWIRREEGEQLSLLRRRRSDACWDARGQSHPAANATRMHAGQGATQNTSGMCRFSASHIQQTDVALQWTRSSGRWEASVQLHRRTQTTCTITFYHANAHSRRAEVQYYNKQSQVVPPLV